MIVQVEYVSDADYPAEEALTETFFPTNFTEFELYGYVMVTELKDSSILQPEVQSKILYVLLFREIFMRRKYVICSGTSLYFDSNNKLQIVR